MRKFVPVLLILALAIPGIACNFSASPQQAPTPVETDACCLNEPEIPVETLLAAPAAATATAIPAAAAAAATATSLPAPSGMTPGWYPYTNANVVRDLVVYDGAVYAATLGGMVSWPLDGGEAARYTPLDGMGHVSANAIVYCEIPEPRILVGTLNGVSAFDPVTGQWEQKPVFPAESRVDASKIERLYCDQANHRLLVGYLGLGVLDLASGAFQRYTQSSGLLWDTVSDIAVNGEAIWIASGYKGIARISGGEVKTYSAADVLPDERASALAFDQDGVLWIGASSGLISYQGGQWVYYDADSPANLRDVNEIEIGPDGKIWAATLPFGAGRLCQFEPGEAVCALDYQDVDGLGIQSLALTASGAPVYGTSQGVSLFADGAARAFKTDDQLASNYVDSLALGPDGQLWVGTDAGIHLIDPANPAGAWRTFRQGDAAGMGGNWARAISVTADGTAWVAFTNGSASRYQDGAWTAFKEIYSFDAVAVDAAGRAWFGDDSKGVVVLNPDGSQAFVLSTAEGLPGNNVQAIAADAAGRVWIGTDQGLAKYENDTLAVVFGPDSTELPNKYIRALALDAAGRLVIGTFTGVARYDGTQVEVLVDFLKDGFADARLTTLAVSPDERVWVGTDKGLLAPDGAGWALLTPRDGLLTQYVSALYADPSGTVWVGGGGSNFDGGGMIQIVP